MEDFAKKIYIQYYSLLEISVFFTENIHLCMNNFPRMDMLCWEMLFVILGVANGFLRQSSPLNIYNRDKLDSFTM